MPEARLGRLLPACLHQAIADVLPDRLEFYEEWLDPVSLRNGTIGLAPLSAVTGFLRTEGGAYRAVMARAGTLAGQWTTGDLASPGRRFRSWLPVALRMRLGLRATRRIVRDILSTSSATSRVRRGHATLQVDASAFCSVRERAATPLCDFYQALVVEVLGAYQIPAEASIQSCRAVAGGACVLSVDVGVRREADQPAKAA
jgi:hypothetical protein